MKILCCCHLCIRNRQVPQIPCIVAYTIIVETSTLVLFFLDFYHLCVAYIFFSRLRSSIANNSNNININISFLKFYFHSILKYIHTNKFIFFFKKEHKSTEASHYISLARF